MSHEISILNGVAELAFLASEGACWHGIGNPVDDNADRDAWMNAANISNWHIAQCKSTFIDPNGVIRRVPGQIQLVRSDNFTHLGTVTESFKVHQPQDVTNWMFDLAQHLGCTMSTMGVLFDGKKFWCQMNTNEAVAIGGIDRVEGRILVAVPNTGKEGTVISQTTTRVVCNNTLRQAQRDGCSMLKINHMNEFSPAEINEKLGIHDMKEWASLADAMARVKMTDDATIDYLAKVFAIYEETELPEDVVEAAAEKKAIAADNRTVMNCFSLFKGEGVGSEMATAKGTLWGAVNSVTEYVDHKRNCRTWDNKFDSAMFGSMANVKDTAWDEALMFL